MVGSCHVFLLFFLTLTSSLSNFPQFLEKGAKSFEQVLKRIINSNTSKLLNEAKIIRETKKAYLIDHVCQQVWVPKSVVFKANEKGIEIVNWFVENHFN